MKNSTFAKKCIMTSINIETNPLFKKELAKLNFRKKGEFFVREVDEAVQELGFGYATYGQKHTRYYNCIYGINYPKAVEMGQNLGEYVWGTEEQIGYRIPQRKFFWQKPVYEFKSWRVSATDSERDYSKTMMQIVDSIGKYIVPFMDQFSTMRSFVDALEAGRMNIAYDEKMPPILYRLLGEEEKAQSYIEKMIAHYSSPEYNRLCGTTEVIETKDYKEVIYRSPNNNLKNYQEFARKFYAAKDGMAVGGIGGDGSLQAKRKATGRRISGNP